jgi:hypothetical protein
MIIDSLRKNGKQVTTQKNYVLFHSETERYANLHTDTEEHVKFQSEFKTYM